jgi:polysaccharide export outer membrane protein
MQALATAGGLNPFAKRSRITIFRHEGEKTSLFKFDYDDVANGKSLEKNIQLKRGDVIVVP